MLERHILEELEEDLMFMKPRAVFDQAIIGIGENSGGYYLVYSQDKVIELHQAMTPGSSRVDSEEWFQMNVVKGLVRPDDPIYMEGFCD